MTNEIIQIIADKLQKPTEEITKIMISGKQLEGIIDIIILIVGLIFAFFIAKFVTEKYRKDNDYETIIFIGTFLISLIVIICIGAGFEWAILAIIKPDYVIINNIIINLISK